MIKFEKITTTRVTDDFLKEVQDKANSIKGRVINICMNQKRFSLTTGFTVNTASCTSLEAIIWYEEAEKTTMINPDDEKEQLIGICRELKTFSDYIDEESFYISFLCKSNYVDYSAFTLIEKKDLDLYSLEALESKKKSCLTQRCWYDNRCILGTPAQLYYYDFYKKCLVPLIENKEVAVDTSKKLPEEYTDPNTEYEFNPESRLLEPNKKMKPGVYTNFQAPERSLDEMVVLESNYFDKHFEESGLVLVEDTSLFPEIATIEDCVIKSESDTDGRSKTLYRRWDDVHCRYPYYFSQREEDFVPLYPCENNNYIGKVNAYSSKEYDYIKPFVEANILTKVEYLDLPYKVKKYMAKNKSVFHKHVWVDKHNHLHKGSGTMYYYSTTADMLIEIDVDKED